MRPKKPRGRYLSERELLEREMACELWASGSPYTADVVAGLFGITRRILYRWRVSIDGEKHKENVPARRKAEAVALYVGGLSARAVAARFRVSTKSVTRWLAAAGVEQRAQRTKSVTSQADGLLASILRERGIDPSTYRFDEDDDDDGDLEGDLETEDAQAGRCLPSRGGGTSAARGGCEA